MSKWKHIFGSTSVNLHLSTKAYVNALKISQSSIGHCYKTHLKQTIFATQDSIAQTLPSWGNPISVPFQIHRPPQAASMVWYASEYRGI